ncbi:AAA family ATPase [Bowmanella pacifica]|uniref:Pilus assembly protein CpaE n=1 Tax=Bowmanella pacifica TaxID=502051 RepID=A0A918DGP9_9ALTE|nr:AAA family ATPase [Bowmanella pacifica]GGO65099.1 hypothetical protein GCM10010982_06090 [Bowmanella pacifica]
MTYPTENRIIDLSQKQLAMQMRNNRMKLAAPLSILVVCQAPDALNALQSHLGSTENLNADFYANLPEQSQSYQAAILVCPADASQVAEQLSSLSRHCQHLLLIGEDMDNDTVRQAVKFNVRDIIPPSQVDPELLNALRDLAAEHQQHGRQAPIISVINGKAGSGASFLTCSLGELCSQGSDRHIAMFDADYNFGSLSHMLGVQSQYSINDALEELERLDDTAIKSMMTKKDNLNLLSNRPFARLEQFGQQRSERTQQLLWKIRSNFDLLLVDLSKGIESHTVPIIEMTSLFLVVVQLNVACLREAKVLIQYLRQQMGVDANKIHLVINRYQKGNQEITHADVEKVIGLNSIFHVANNYQAANLHTDLGTPLSKLQDNRNLVRDLQQVVDAVFPFKVQSSKKSTGLFGRLMGR